MTTLIKNVYIIDGTGIAPFLGDVLLRDHEIIAAGHFPDYRADMIVHGNESYLCPGFIDVNTSSDRYTTLFSAPLHGNFITQGVTTILLGQCGFSLAPTLYGALSHMSDWAPTGKINSDWRTVSELLTSLTKSFSFGVNIATLVGHKVMREDILKDPRVWRNLHVNELRILRALLADACAQGAFGLSAGLGYHPYEQTTYHELRALADIIAHMKALYAVHVRDEKEGIVSGIQEIIRLAHDTGARMLVNHMRPFLGYETQFDEALRLLETRGARAGIFFSANPFSYSAVPLDSFLPNDLRTVERSTLMEMLSDSTIIQKISKQIPRLHAATVTIVHAPHAEFLNGTTLQKFATDRGLTTARAIIELIRITHAKGFLFYENLNKESIDKELISPQAVIASNSPSLDVSAAFYTDRAHKSFSLFLERMNALSQPLESSIARLTRIPAQLIGIEKRGQIASGYFADLVLLSRDFTVQRVWVNGKSVLEDGMLVAQPNVSYGSILKKHT